MDKLKKRWSWSFLFLSVFDKEIYNMYYICITYHVCNVQKSVKLLLNITHNRTYIHSHTTTREYHKNIIPYDWLWPTLFWYPYFFGPTWLTAKLIFQSLFLHPVHKMNRTCKKVSVETSNDPPSWIYIGWKRKQTYVQMQNIQHDGYICIHSWKRKQK